MFFHSIPSNQLPNKMSALSYQNINIIIIDIEFIFTRHPLLHIMKTRISSSKQAENEKEKHRNDEVEIYLKNYRHLQTGSTETRKIADLSRRSTTSIVVPCSLWKRNGDESDEM